VAEATVHTFETPGHAVLRVQVPAGTVTVETWSEPRVEVEVAPGRDDDRSLRAAAGTRVAATERAGAHEIDVRVPKREGRLSIGFGRGPELRVAIRCPVGTEVDHATHSADLRGRGALGGVTVKSASGDASLDDVESLEFTTASGDLTAGAVAGSLSAKSASGDIDVRSVEAIGAVNTVSGDVRVGETGGPVKVQTVSGDVALEAAAASVSVSSVSGDVKVAAVPGLVLQIDAQSVSGSMSSELDVGDEPAGPGEEAVELRVRTVSGDVRVARSPALAR
jgi:DUF4097 and DUF4098 domain-containing protein YvlB